MLESLERLVGARQHTGTTVLASQADLAAAGREHRVPGDFGDYGPAAYRDHMVPFCPYDLHEWVASESLRDRRAVLVPRDLAFFGQSLSTSRWAMVCSSGVATGSTREEAIAFGLMELIERDAFVNSWYARVPGRRIDVESVPGLRPLLNRASLLGHRIELLWVPSETGLPVMVAVARATSAAPSVLPPIPSLPVQHEGPLRRRGPTCLSASRPWRPTGPVAWTCAETLSWSGRLMTIRCSACFRGAEDLDDYLGDGPTGPLDEVVTAGPLARMGASGVPGGHGGLPGVHRS